MITLYLIFITSVFGQFFDNDVFGYNEGQLFGREGSELRTLADGVSFDSPTNLGRSAGEFGSSAFGRSLPPGINLMDYIGPSGEFNLVQFREALLAAYVAQSAFAVQETAPIVETTPIVESAQIIPETEERYFFTTSTTTTTLPPVLPPTTIDQPSSCWKCDQMSFNECAAQGHYEECTLGDKDCCFIEVRTKHQNLQQLCTGCKAKQACMDNQKQNFAIDDDTTMSVLRDQCRTDLRMQLKRFRNGSQQSVCRQCFNPCNPGEFDNRYCFGSILSNTPVQFTVPYAAEASRYPGATAGGKTDEIGFGIPSGLLVDATLDTAAAAKIEDFTVRDLYYDVNSPHGKQDDTAGDGVRQVSDMTYWSIQHNAKAWWRDDLKVRANTYTTSSTGGTCVFNGLSTNAATYTSCTAHLVGIL